MEIVAFLLLLIVIGILFYMKTDSDAKHDMLERRMAEMRSALENLRKQLQDGEKTVKTPEPPAVPEPVSRIPDPKPEVAPPPSHFAPKVNEPVPEKPVAAMPALERVASFSPQPEFKRPEPKPYIPEKSWWDGFKERNPDLEKFIGENLINKIGVLILVLGISYFVKYAIDRDWINEPARVGVGILAGAIVLGFAHRLRKNFKPFSSVLVAGAIAIFYFTIAIAFHDYHLFSQTTAFVIMVGITGFSSFIALSYDRLELAILTLIGGFAVPFIVSTGEGNYVVLFTYIMILDAGILAIAYFKKWQVLNLLSFIFTMLLFAGWMNKDINTEHPHYMGILGFSAGFYFLFTVMTMIHNLRRGGAFSGAELGMVVSNTFIFYGIGLIALDGWHPELKGGFTAVVAVFNILYALILFRKFGADRTAVYLLIGMALTFITLAVPVQFAGHNITLFWSAEMVVLMWLGKKSGMVNYRLASVAVLVLASVSLLMDWVQVYQNGTQEIAPVFNWVAATGIFYIGALVSLHFMLRKEEDAPLEWKGLATNPVAFSRLCLILAAIAGYFAGLQETTHASYIWVFGNGSKDAFPALFHLLYTTLICLAIRNGNDKKLSQVVQTLCSVNIVFYTFWFSRMAFIENAEFLASESGQRIAFILHYVSLAIVIGNAWLLYGEAKRYAESIFRHPGFLWIGTFFAVWTASSELMLHALVISGLPYAEIAGPSMEIVAQARTADNIENQVIRTGFPILWGLLAFALLIAGIRRNLRTLRIISLTLLGITIVKLFAFDIRNASETGKIIAFILLGVLILVISFVYQKIKKLVIDNQQKENEPDQ